MSRVTARTIKNATTDAVISTETYAYDAAGNMIDDNTETAFGYDANNRLVNFGGNNVSYDLDGNMTDCGNYVYDYDSANRLVYMGGHSYTYNAEDVRIRNVYGSYDITYTYDTNCKLSRLLTKTNNGFTTKYVYGLGLIGEDKGGSFKTYHFDYRGSTIAITDINGNVTDTFAYDTYGKVISRTGTSYAMFGYNGRDGVITDENGLIYMRARYYSPDMRRFINADVVAGEISNAITLNRFAYANGNPVSMSDPFGLSAADLRGISSSKTSVNRDSYDIRLNKSSKQNSSYDPEIISFIIAIGNGSISPEDYCQQQEFLKEIASIDTSGIEIDQDLVDVAHADMQAYIASRNSLLSKDDPFETSNLRWKAIKSAMAVFGQLTVETIEDVVEYVGNDSEQVVLNAKYFAFYKGKMVIKLPIGTDAFSFGIIFLGDDVQSRTNSIETVQHEYGHTKQFEKYGFWGYSLMVMVPSVAGYWLDREVIPNNK